jgi:Ni/Co efflux regulator RcnB
MRRVLIPLLLAAAATPAIAAADDGSRTFASATPPASSESLRQSDRPLPRVLRNRVPGVGSAPTEGSQPPLRLDSRRRVPDGEWSSHWRSDRRYDWSSWRNRHRSLFRLGEYSDPFGWRYRPYPVGSRLWPSYYGSSYWLHDPWQYRLPYAPPGHRWVRYYDDAVLVDTWDGRVVDVIYSFFW